MKQNDIEQCLRNIVSRLLENRLPAEMINDNLNLVEAGFDSMQFIKLVIAIENEFNIILGADDLDKGKLLRFGLIKEMIYNKLK